MPTPDLMKPSPDIIQVGPGGLDGGFVSPKPTQPSIWSDLWRDVSGEGGSYNPMDVTEDPVVGPNSPVDKTDPIVEYSVDNSSTNYDEGSDYQDTGLEESKDENNVVEDYSTGASLSEWLRQNPGATYEDAMKYMAQHSDEWAEKLIDYYANQASYKEDRDYQASREDNAYQRLVADMRKAGLNPALMYGSSASPQVGSYSSYAKVSGDATSAGISNYSKIKNVMLAYLTYELQKNLGISGQANKWYSSITNVLGDVGKLLLTFLL